MRGATVVFVTAGLPGKRLRLSVVSGCTEA